MICISIIGSSIILIHISFQQYLIWKSRVMDKSLRIKTLLTLNEIVTELKKARQPCRRCLLLLCGPRLLEFIYRWLHQVDQGYAGGWRRLSLSLIGQIGVAAGQALVGEVGSDTSAISVIFI